MNASTATSFPLFPWRTVWLAMVMACGEKPCGRDGSPATCSTVVAAIRKRRCKLEAWLRLPQTPGGALIYQPRRTHVMARP
ncbi:hypothetical protein N658DRAFT_491195 [Parathielavia hyrcaniae]|uniref:Secreted protein n=1 Tax=Parathielavia hyrcaniae TaxID=113614 RepID=A0AAN6QAF5_9PEZI|nr:hypothetical protein N658DRAFT_491195 [Parathielavia hyrcaniae]